MKTITSENKLRICLSKREWLKISNKSVVVNGKTYLVGEMYPDNDGKEFLLEDFVMNDDEDAYIFKAYYDDGETKNIVMPLPPAKELTIANITFKVGKKYKNRKGEYKVIDIDIPKQLLTVKYIGGEFDGQEQVLKASDMYKVIRNIQLERDHQLGIDRIDFGSEIGNYFTIGFLAKNGKVTVQTTDEKEDETRRIYQGLTGRPFEPNQLEVVPKINPTTGGFNKYTHEFRIFFRVPSQDVIDKMTFPADLEIKSVGKNSYSINNNNYVLNLLEKGFVAGSNVGNIDRIRGQIPRQFLDAFDAGVNAQ